ncbi:MAG: hypothetical protein N838_24465 [Thiohalocapsa sp. PB-PSB1]|nr:MAG: hypothetical protein N838_24465 [Thiohalocapsa sp. PB-PSB1]
MLELTQVTAILLLPALLLLQGCGGAEAPTRPEPARMQAYLVATDDLNSGAGGVGLPVQVRLYELKSTGAFSGADFFSLYQKESEILGAELVAREELSLTPGQALRLEKTLPPESAFIGVVAAFRDIDRAQWRDVARLKPNHANQVTVKVTADSITVAAQ